jgi:hypothetical protein
LGKRHLTVEWLERLATALDCHAWTIVGDLPGPSLSQAEQVLIDVFRRLSDGQQKAFLDAVIAQVEDAPPRPARITRR